MCVCVCTELLPIISLPNRPFAIEFNTDKYLIIAFCSPEEITMISFINIFVLLKCK